MRKESVNWVLLVGICAIIFVVPSVLYAQEEPAVIPADIIIDTEGLTTAEETLPAAEPSADEETGGVGEPAATGEVEPTADEIAEEFAWEMALTEQENRKAQEPEDE